jgi:hypothetical protein
VKRNSWVLAYVIPLVLEALFHLMMPDSQTAKQGTPTYIIRPHHKLFLLTLVHVGNQNPKDDEEKGDLREATQAQEKFFRNLRF